LLGTAAAVLSAGVHVVVFFGLGTVRVDAAVPRDEVVEFTVVEEQPAEEAPPPPPPPAPEPEPEPKPEPVKPRIKEASPAPVEEAPPPDPTPPAPAEETIADFSGTTLTGEGSGGWTTAVGSGAPMNAPIGKPKAAVTGRERDGTEGGAIGGTGTRVVSEADLSRSPKVPSAEALNEALKREFPKDAQQQGIEGVARIRVRVFATGKLSPLTVLSESYPGFAEACKRSLRDQRFEPGLDRQGQPVATDINFKCEFTLE
jgi:outer membrane biosynthesis protein TonB